MPVKDFIGLFKLRTCVVNLTENERPEALEFSYPSAFSL